jgi:hypothetical protein
VLLLVAWLVLARGGSAPDPATATAASPSGDLPLLRRELDRLRGDLGAQVADLERQLTGLEQRVARVEASGPSEPPPDVTREPTESSPAPRRTAGFDAERLTETGMREEEVEQLQLLWQELEMEKLHLADLAAREGWADTQRYSRELWELDQAPREELDDDAYDRYLYAAGRPNRVVVGHVISRSSAAEAGLRPGDAILRYGDQRVFSGQDLIDAASVGTPGESAEMEVLRDGHRLRLQVPRGPLGVLPVLQRQPPLYD